MKRIILISSAVVIGSLVAVSFTSCKQKEGVYSPKEGKISKIYYENYSVIYSLSSGNEIDKITVTPKKLLEVWKWDKKKLLQIQQVAPVNGDPTAFPWTLYFIYKGQQIQRIESGNDVFKFTYEDKDSKLKTIEVVDDQNRPKLTITVDARSNDKITKLTYVSYVYTESPDPKNLVSKLRPIANLMMGENIGESMVKSMEDNAKIQKKVTTTETKTVVELTYEKNNISEENRTVIVGNSTAADNKIIKYKYDTKLNPYYQAFCVMYNAFYTSDRGNEQMNAIFAPYSENNIESYSTYNPSAAKPDIAVDTINYVYKYNNANYPTERDMVRETVRDTARYVDHKVYTYEYVTK